MNLIEHMMEPFTILDRVSVEDGEGGFISKYKPGAKINAAITHDSSITAKIAEAEGVTSVYTITTTKSVILAFHQVLRRESDGQVFRVTTNGRDRKTPSVAGLNMAQVSAEAWKLPSTEADNE